MAAARPCGPARDPRARRRRLPDQRRAPARQTDYRAERIPDFPQAGRVVPEFAVDDVREIIETPYRIIYRILGDRIDVLTVMHGARLLREIPRR